MKRLILLLALLGAALSLHAEPQEPGVYAKLFTSKGLIVAKIEYQKVPVIAENFVRLAEGGIEWRIPNTETWVTRPLYQDIPFHRVVEDFVIQTGDPTGTGYGGPGFYVRDQFHPKLLHKSAGVLSMANHGPGTNGSQFFITLGEAPWLDGKHAVFGKVVEGLEVVRKIEQGDKLRQIKILRIGPQAQRFATGVKMREDR